MSSPYIQFSSAWALGFWLWFPLNKFLMSQVKQHQEIDYDAEKKDQELRAKSPLKLDIRTEKSKCYLQYRTSKTNLPEKVACINCFYTSVLNITW